MFFVALAACIASAQVPLAWITPAQLPAATRGAVYATGLSAMGGTPPYTFTLMSGALPAGLQLTAQGEIRGTPTQAGNFSFTIRVAATCVGTGCTPASVDRGFTLAVSGPTLALVPDSLPAATGCGTYSFTVTATGGTTPYTYSATGLPTGIVLQASTGVLSGTAAAGTYPVSITVRDGTGATAAKNYSLQVVAPSLPQITTATLAAGTVGAAYSASLAASGGTAPYTFTVADTPVPGVTLAPGGLLSGTPTQAGSFATLYRVADSASCAATRRLTTEVGAAQPAVPLSITTTGLTSARADQSYTQTLAATGGTPPYVWSLAGGELPPGLEILPEGAITGTPTQKGAYAILIRVTDTAQRTAIRQYGIVVNSAMVIETATLPAGRVGAIYSFGLTASGGQVPLTWLVSSGSLPVGMQLNLFSGVLAGTPFAAGEFTFEVTVRDGANFTASKSLTLSVGEVLSITTDRLPNGKILEPYSASVVASGGVPPLEFQATGLPPGLTMDPSGAISGTPATAGAWVVAVKVTDSTKGVVTKSVVLTIDTVFRIVTEALTPGQAGSPYSETLTAVDGRQPYRWSVPPRALPLGISLNDLTGQLQGTPLEPGEYSVPVRVTDAANASAEKTFSLSIRNGFRITTETLPSANVNVAYSAAFQTAGARTPISWSLSSGSLPPGFALDPAAGVISGRTNSTGEFSFTVKAVDATLTETAKDFAIKVRDVLRFSPAALASADAGTTYRQTIQALDAQGPLTWTLLNGVLPEGLRVEFSSDSATITGTPAKAGSYQFTLQARDTAGQTATQPFTIRVVAALTILSDTLRGGFVSVAYTAALTAEGGEPPYTWALSAGALPAGIQLDAERGTLTGVPTQAGTFGFTLEARDTKSRRASKALSIRVIRDLTPTLESLSAATVGLRYTQQLRTVVTEVAWSISDGRLPEGLTLDAATGEIRGVPSRDGTYNFTVQAREAGGASGSRPYTIVVARLDLPRFTIDPTAAQPARQVPLVVTLSAPAPTDLTGSVTLRFQPEVGTGDPAVRLSTGSTAPFTVAQGSTRAVFAPGAFLQTGTTAGTITLVASLASNGVAVTPEPAPVRTIRVPKLPPAITSVVARRVGAALAVEVTGYATGREVKAAEFQFSGGPKFAISLDAVLSQWFQERQSQTFGSLFTITIPFLAIDAPAVTVTLSNSSGNSEPRTAPVSRQ